ncbi:MAG: HAD family hydrolase [Phycisphaerae bacterium]|jgi:beta-phosphoglucomutase
MGLEAVIFDFDGVLADTELLHYRAFCAALESEGVRLEKDVYWEKYLGYTDKEAFEQMSSDFGFSLNANKLSWLIDEKAARFDEFVRLENSLLPGVTELLLSLREAGVPMAICSGALLCDIEGVFECARRHSGIDYFSFFDVVVTAEDVADGKPHPEGYEKTMELLSSDRESFIRPERCVVVEDSHWGLEAARSAGMRTIAVCGSYSAEELAGFADFVVGSLTELNAEIIAAVAG